MHPAFREVRGEFLQAQPGHPTHDPLIGPHHHVWDGRDPQPPSSLAHAPTPISSFLATPLCWLHSHIYGEALLPWPLSSPLTMLAPAQPQTPPSPSQSHTLLLTSDLGLTLFPPPLQVLSVIVEPFQAHDPIMQTHSEQRGKWSHR